MTVFLNLTTIELPSGISVNQLLKQQHLKPAGIAVAINQQVLPRQQWDNYEIKANDNIDIFNVVAGG